MKRLILLGLLLWVQSTAAIAQQFKAVDAYVDSLISSQVLPSVAVGIIERGSLIHFRVKGYADKEGEVSASTTTPYQLASLTKPITATAIMILHEQGKIDINEPVTRYITPLKLQMADAYTIPTVRQVLNHTAGLGTYFDIYYSDQEDAYTSFEDAWEDYGIVFNQPGLVSEYSNIGYGLLQFIIEKQSNLTFDQFLQQEIFLPLGMTDASVLTGQAYPSFARKYDTHGEPLPEVWNNTAGAGNVEASLFDVFRFAAWFMSDSDEHLSKELRNEMMTYVEPGGLFHYYESTKYGLGWYFKQDGQKRVVWHEGGMTGASSMLRMFPDEDVAIVVLTNTFNSPVVRALTDQISELIFENYQPKPLNEVAEYKEVADDSLFIGSWIGSVNTGTQQWPVRLHVSGESIDLEVEGMERQSWLFGLSNEQRLIGNGMGSAFMHFDRSERTNIWSYKLLYDEGKLVGSIVLLGYGEREYFAYPFAITLERE